MSRREPCRNFQRGRCQYGDRCKFLHVTPQQSRPNPFGFGTQNTSQFFHTGGQQQKPNPFGFGVQNGSGSKGTPSFGARYESSTKPFENKWTRTSSTSAVNPSPQAATQLQSATHQCTHPESCKRQIEEDFKNELPLWKLTCYGHWKYLPCDIVGDISYEELRAAAYQDYKSGLPLQAIIEREKNLYNSKSAEFANLLSNPFVPPSAGSTGTTLFPGANQNAPPMSIQNNSPAQSNAPPSFSSFSQLGTLTNFGSNVRPHSPATVPNSVFGQPNFPQYNSQNSGGIEAKFGNSESFNSLLPTQPFGSSPGPNTFQNGFAATRSNQVSSPFAPAQFPNITSNQWPSSMDVPENISDTANQDSIPENLEDGPDDSIWLKEEWAIGEIPIVAPPARFCR